MKISKDNFFAVFASVRQEIFLFAGLFTAMFT